MRKFLVLTFVALFAMVGVVSAADTAQTSAALKIGVVDMQTLAQDSDPAKAGRAELEKKYGKERKDLEDEGEKLRKRAEKLKDPKASEESKLAFLRAKQDLDQKTRNFMRKVEQDEVKMRQDMIVLVFNATYNVAQRKNFNFVVDVTAGGVLYAEQSMDLTKDVLAEVNKMFKEKGKKAATEKPKGK
ncbi:MAG: OmpH family outer membrane protein [Candidatus Desulfovibrio faecigallinarum]|uniref:OmpH family outer membrane protein n=1 Tax=Desulfovibrio sp. An276 TaxID=1965618 RepID=UPI000B378099|nr:OmpH family outer membrane protein [Desulfovibrio sp. An276]MBU3831117.1 OmpH family outer membrane protein [Candidatus Desulfovibrio faecigallinarum]OUO55174.1 hypothetical protein B5F76_00735 [Desulfovibrio sp. An276]